MEEKLPKDFNEVLEGIHTLKNEKDMTWMDAILEFCEENNYRIEDVGFMLSENKNFKKILESDFVKHRHLRTAQVIKIKNMIEDWS